MVERRQPRGVGDASPRSTQRSDASASLNDMIAGLIDLDVKGLRLQWRNHLGGTPPAHLPRWLLSRILAYRIQAAMLSGLDKETLRVLRRPKGEPADPLGRQAFATRAPTTRDGAKLRAGALLTREWNRKLERVIVLDKGFAWNGETYGSLSQVAKAMTGTKWNGHRFFGLRTVKPDRTAKVSPNARVSDDAPPDTAPPPLTRDGKARRCAGSLDVARAAAGQTAPTRSAHCRDGGEPASP